MKKMVGFVSRATLVLLLLGIVGCGKTNTPNGIAGKCVECLEDADFEGMRQMATGEMFQWLDRAERRYDEIAKLLGEKKAKKIKSTYDNLKFEVGEVSSSDNAQVVVPVKINGQNTPMTLNKRGENWRIEKFEFPII